MRFKTVSICCKQYSKEDDQTPLYIGNPLSKLPTPTPGSKTVTSSRSLGLRNSLNIFFSRSTMQQSAIEPQDLAESVGWLGRDSPENEGLWAHVSQAPPR